MHDLFMIVASLLVGALTAFYFGRKAGAWAAIVTFAACAAAFFLPRYALYIYLALGAGTVGVVMIGSRRPRPPEAVRAVRWARRAGGLVYGRARSLLDGVLGGDSKRDDSRNDRDRRR